MLNFGRYLDRLGVKARVQPVVLQTVQPVALVADLSTLVSPAFRPSGIVGGATTPTLGVDAAAFQAVAPVPMRIQLVMDNSFAGQWRIQIGAPVPMATSTVLTPQPGGEFGGDQFESRWLSGTVLIADIPGPTLPTFRTTNASSIILPVMNVPGGATLTICCATTGNGTAGMLCEFYELPSETPA